MHVLCDGARFNCCDQGQLLPPCSQVIAIRVDDPLAPLLNDVADIDRCTLSSCLARVTPSFGSRQQPTIYISTHNFEILAVQYALTQCLCATGSCPVSLSGS